MPQSSSPLKNLDWYSIPSRIGDLGKADLPPQMTVAEIQSLINQSIKLDGKHYRIGAVQTYRGVLQITAFPANGNNGNRQTLRVG